MVYRPQESAYLHLTDSAHGFVNFYSCSFNVCVKYVRFTHDIEKDNRQTEDANSQHAHTDSCRYLFTKTSIFSPIAVDVKLRSHSHTRAQPEKPLQLLCLFTQKIYFIY